MCYNTDDWKWVKSARHRRTALYDFTHTNVDDGDRDGKQIRGTRGWAEGGRERPCGVTKALGVESDNGHAV